MNIKNELINRSPALLMGAGLLGFITATVMSARATPKAMDILEGHAHDERDGYPPASKLQKARDVAPVYLPTAGMLLISAGMVISSDRIIRKRYASLLALYTITDRALKEWEAATNDEVSPKKVDKIRERVFGPAEDPPAGEMQFVDGRSVFYDFWSGRYFYADSVDTVRRAIADVNLRLVKEDFVPLNDYYFALGMDPTQMGSDIGWHVEGEELTARFDTMLRNDRSYIVVFFQVEPRKWT